MCNSIESDAAQNQREQSDGHQPHRPMGDRKLTTRADTTAYRWFPPRAGAVLRLPPRRLHRAFRRSESTGARAPDHEFDWLPRATPATKPCPCTRRSRLIGHGELLLESHLVAGL